MFSLSRRCLAQVAVGLRHAAKVALRPCSTQTIPSSMFGDDVPFEEPEIVQWEKGLSADAKEIFSALKSEYVIYRYADSQVPKKLSVIDCEKLIHMNKSDRIKYLTYLFRLEHMQNSRMLKKAQREKLMAERHEKYIQMRDESPHIYYGLGGCFMMRRITDSLISRVDEARLGVSAPFNPNIVFDMKPLTELSLIEVSLTWVQLRESYFSNRAHRYPFNIHLVDCVTDHISWSDSRRYFVEGVDRYMVDCVSDSPVNVFPKDRLVYLSPDARSMLTDVSPSDVLVLGAMVDKPSRKNWTVARAKQLGIRCARLPIDRFVKWECGSKSLTLNQCMNILLDVLHTGDWRKAFLDNIPKRKLTYKERPMSKIVRGKMQNRMNLLMSLSDQGAGNDTDDVG